jgi:hypothetical protein
MGRALIRRRDKPERILIGPHHCRCLSPIINEGRPGRYQWVCERRLGHLGPHMAWSNYDRNTLLNGGLWRGNHPQMR